MIPSSSGYQKLADILLACSLVSWAALGLVQAPAEDRWTIVRLGISCLHLLTAAMIVLRTPAVTEASATALLASLPGFLIGGFAFSVAPPPSQWTILANGLFLCGIGLVFIAFLTLGSSFAIFPSARELRINGPYRLVRHPAYLGEIMLIGACTCTSVNWKGLLVLALAFPMIASRIHAEEKTLTLELGYQSYAAKIRWRIFPGIW